MILIASPRFDEHTTPPGHPERPERAQVFDAVAAAWREGGGRVVEPRPATRAELTRVHEERYIELIAGTTGRPAMLDPDTFTSPESYEIALLAAGAAVQAADYALDTHDPAIALVRPPGHHAERGRAMGFCLFNNVAVAAAAARARGVSRVAIVDFDVHHGNGTQWAFYDDPTVLYVSTHQYPFYPGTGAADEVGTREGEGFTFNVPLEAGATDADYGQVYLAIASVLEQFAPELVLLSAGYDAHRDDPLASMRLTSAGFHAITAILAGAGRRIGCPVAAVTEGGYDLGALRESVDATIAVLSGRTTAGAVIATGDTSRADRALRQVRAAQSHRWSF